MQLKYSEIISQLTLEEKAALMNGKDCWTTVDISRLGIPSIFLSDGPHGIRKQAAASDHLGLNESLKATCFPTAVTMANSWDLELGNQLGQVLGEEAVSQKVNVLLGPGINMKRNPLCGRNFEYFSEDPYLSGKMASEYIKGIQSNGISGCVKHFACNNQETLRMTQDTIVDERTLREIYLTAFEIAIKEAKPKTIMSSYNMVNGEYTNENTHLMNEILRNEWEFDGVVVSDWGGENDRVLGIKAYNELEMPYSGGQTKLDIIEAVNNNELSIDVLDKCVDRLLDLVFETEKAYVKERVPFDVEKHHEMALKCAEESIVLLKNNNDILPLVNKEKICVIGDFAKLPRYQGAGSSIVNPTKLDSILDIINEYDYEYLGYEPGYNRYGKKSNKLIKNACKLAMKSDVVLLFVGLDEFSEVEGIDRSSICIPSNQLELINKLQSLNKKIVCVLSSGSVVDLSFDEKMEAVIYTGLSGQAGAKAIMNIISGKVNPSGKLTETYPINYADIPSASMYPGVEKLAVYKEALYIGYRYFDTFDIKVKYPFGYGLSYTKFEYSDLVITDTCVKYKVKNIGLYPGKEISQLYIGKKDSNIFRTKKELKGFNKVYLEPNEEKEIIINFDDKSFRYFNVKTNKFEIESGEYQIYIGASILDIKLEGSINVDGTTDVIPYYIKKYDVNSKEMFEVILGHEVPNTELNFVKKNRIIADMNTPICHLRYAKGWTGRLTAWVLRVILKFGGKKNIGTVIMGAYNLPLRNITRMTGGSVSWSQLNGLVTMFNGKFFKGLFKFFKWIK